MPNEVIDRAMRAAFKAWQDEMVRTGKTSVLNAKFDDIAPRDRRLIELQCRAAIASLKEQSLELGFMGWLALAPNYSKITADLYFGITFKAMIYAALNDD